MERIATYSETNDETIEEGTRRLILGQRISMRRLILSFATDIYPSTNSTSAPWSRAAGIAEIESESVVASSSSIFDINPRSIVIFFAVS
jgi:hypothetical protein